MRYSDFYKEYDGPFAKVRACIFCDFRTIVKKGIRGVGRGYGMREGNKARGEIIQHIKKCHPDKLTK